MRRTACRPKRTARRVFCRRRRQAVAAGNQKGRTAAKHRRKAEISREAAKGFNWVSGKLLFGHTDSRFAEPRSSLKKVLIVVVRSCHCGGLNRGLQNLGASRKENGFILFACTKRTKSTPEGCDHLDSRGRFKSPLDTRFWLK